MRIEGNNPLYEDERDIAFDPARGPDERSARTLTGAAQSARVTGTHNRPVGATGASPSPARPEYSRAARGSGWPISTRPTSSPATPTTTTLGVGSIYNATRGELAADRLGQWRI